MDNGPVAGPSRLPMQGVPTQVPPSKELAMRRRRVQKSEALKRQMRSRAFDRAALERGHPSVTWSQPLPNYEKEDEPESRILLEELEIHNLRQRGRAAVAEELNARGMQFLELRPDEGNPFGDITRVLLEAAAGFHQPKVQPSAPVAPPAPVLLPVPPKMPSFTKPASAPARQPVAQPSPAHYPPAASPFTQAAAPFPNGHLRAASPFTPQTPFPPLAALNGQQQRQASPSVIPVAPIVRKYQMTPSLPQVLDGFKVLSLGRFPEQREFFEQGMIFAPGYRVIRPFLSTVAGAANVVAHTCEVLNRDGVPLFRVTAEDTGNTLESFSVVEAWIATGRPAFELRGYRANETAEAALDFFGLSVPRIRKLLEELAAPEIALEAFGVRRHNWVETPSIPDDPDFALRTVETTLVKVSASQAIETVVRPAVSPSPSHMTPRVPSPADFGSRRGSYAAEAMLSPAIPSGRRYSQNADELAKGYPTSYGTPVPGAGMLQLGASAGAGSNGRAQFSPSPRDGSVPGTGVLMLGSQGRGSSPVPGSRQSSISGPSLAPMMQRVPSRESPRPISAGASSPVPPAPAPSMYSQPYNRGQSPRAVSPAAHPPPANGA